MTLRLCSVFGFIATLRAAPVVPQAKRPVEIAGSYVWLVHLSVELPASEQVPDIICVLSIVVLVTVLGLTEVDRVKWVDHLIVINVFSFFGRLQPLAFVDIEVSELLQIFLGLLANWR